MKSCSKNTSYYYYTIHIYYYYIHFLNIIFLKTYLTRSLLCLLYQYLSNNI